MITPRRLALFAVSSLLVAGPLWAEAPVPPAIPSQELPGAMSAQSTPATVAPAGPRLSEVTPALQPLVQKMLYDPKDGHREDAAEDLEKVGDSTCIAALQWAAVNDSEKDVRKHAARAIEKISRRTAPKVVAAVAVESRVLVAPPPTIVVYTAPRVVIYSPAPVCYPLMAPAPVYYSYSPAPCYRPGGFFFFSYRSSGHHRH